MKQLGHGRASQISQYKYTHKNKYTHKKAVYYHILYLSNFCFAGINQILSGTCLNKLNSAESDSTCLFFSSTLSNEY